MESEPQSLKAVHHTVPSTKGFQFQALTPRAVTPGSSCTAPCVYRVTLLLCPNTPRVYRVPYAPTPLVCTGYPMPPTPHVCTRYATMHHLTELETALVEAGCRGARHSPHRLVVVAHRYTHRKQRLNAVHRISVSSVESNRGVKYVRPGSSGVQHAPLHVCTGYPMPQHPLCVPGTLSIYATHV